MRLTGFTAQVRDASDYLVASVGHAAEAQCVANALLIAAAPDLLAALADVLAHIDQGRAIGLGAMRGAVDPAEYAAFEQGARSGYERARAAIAKATGT